MVLHLKLLLDTLENLGSKELKRFTLFLKENSHEGRSPVTAEMIENPEAMAIASKMISFYRHEQALEVTVSTLMDINQFHLAESLRTKMKEIQGRKERQQRKRTHSVTKEYAKQTKREHENILTHHAHNQSTSTENRWLFYIVTQISQSIRPVFVKNIKAKVSLNGKI